MFRYAVVWFETPRPPGGVFRALPNMGQGNLYKRVTTAAGPGAVEILPYLEQDNLV